MMVDIQANTMTPNAAGSVEGELVLYLDADNYVKVGPYKDGAGAVNDLAYIRWKRGGGAEQTLAAAGASTDTDKRTYIILFTDDYLIFYVTGSTSPYKKLYFPEMAGFIVKLAAGTTHNADVCDIDFTDFNPVTDITSFEMAMLMQAILGASVAGAQILENEVSSPGTGEISLTNTDMATVEFTTASFGSVFELTLIADPDKTTTGFDDHGAVASVLTVSISKKISGAYTSLPMDSYPWVQGSLDKNISIERLLCSEDTKIGFQLSVNPATSPVEIPYRYVVRKLKE